MTTQKLPGTDAARHGTGDADLTIMLAAHRAFRRDLTRLARAAAAGRPSRPGQAPVGRGRLGAVQARTAPAPHRRGRDHLAGPAAAAGKPRARPVGARRHGGGARAHRPPAGRGGRRVRAGDPEAADWPGEDRLADVIDALASTLTGHLAHEERDGLPLIGVALTAAEWRGAGFRIARRNGLSEGGEMFAWMLDGAAREDAAATLRALPPPVRLLYRAVWKPRFERTPRW